PIASPGDYEAVRRIALEVGTPNGPVIAGLARAQKADIDRAWQAVRHAAKPRIHTFLASSDIHLQHKLKISRQECLLQVREMVTYARGLCADVEFSPEDAARSDPDFLHEVVGLAIQCGASTVNIPDTVGYTTPDEFGALIRDILLRVPGADKTIISVHCHNDLGLATANTLAGIHAGARQAEVTVNGIGERAGNTSLEEVVMALYTRPKFFGLRTTIDTTQIVRSSRMVSSYTGIPVQPNKAIVGANAFAHEAGIHQDGMLKNPLTYEIMKPEVVGLSESNLVLGKHSGRHAFNARLQSLGYDLTREQLDQVFDRFKQVCDKKKVVDDRDLEALIADELYQPTETFRLEYVQVTTGTGSTPTATVRLRNREGEEFTDAATGAGPVDAVYRAINRIVGEPNELIEFSIKAVAEGIDSIGEVTIRIQTDQPIPGSPASVFSGHGASTDIIVASGRAYMSALNKLLAARREVSELPTPNGTNGTNGNGNGNGHTGVNGKGNGTPAPVLVPAAASPAKPTAVPAALPAAQSEPVVSPAPAFFPARSALLQNDTDVQPPHW
ncbi:MAG: 2-isopropylmalate synthase, partial [Chloroflexota bacterium]|nr:2-isopropylmalate synthase [Chloroflexota bacterium]